MTRIAPKSGENILRKLTIMGKTFRHEKGWGRKRLKGSKLKKKVNPSSHRESSKTEDFWDDPLIWEKEGNFEKFSRGKKR